MGGRALECVSVVGPLYITTTRSVGQGVFVGGGFMLALSPAVVPAIDDWRGGLTPVPLRASGLVPIPMVQARHSFEATCASPGTRDSQGEELSKGFAHRPSGRNGIREPPDQVRSSQLEAFEWPGLHANTRPHQRRLEQRSGSPRQSAAPAAGHGKLRMGPLGRKNPSMHSLPWRMCVVWDGGVPGRGQPEASEIRQDRTMVVCLYGRLAWDDRRAAGRWAGWVLEHGQAVLYMYPGPVLQLWMATRLGMHPVSGACCLPARRPIARGLAWREVLRRSCPPCRPRRTVRSARAGLWERRARLATGSPMLWGITESPPIDGR